MTSSIQELILKKWMLWGITILLILVIGGTYYRVYVSQNYLISHEAACDPVTESCFLYECTAEDGEECEDWLYKIVTKKASDWNLACGTSNIDECVAVEKCHITDAYCEIEYCVPENTEGIECEQWGMSETYSDAKN